MLSKLTALFFMALVCVGIYIGHAVYEGDYKDKSEMVGLIIVSSALIFIAGFGVLECLFGDWVMEKMYGKFSNRNPWGR